MRKRSRQTPGLLYNDYPGGRQVRDTRIKAWHPRRSRARRAIASHGDQWTGTPLRPPKPPFPDRFGVAPTAPSGVSPNCGGLSPQPP